MTDNLIPIIITTLIFGGLGFFLGVYFYKLKNKSYSNLQSRKSHRISLRQGRNTETVRYRKKV